LRAMFIRCWCVNCPAEAISKPRVVHGSIFEPALLDQRRGSRMDQGSPRRSADALRERRQAVARRPGASLGPSSARLRLRHPSQGHDRRADPHSNWIGSSSWIWNTVADSPPGFGDCRRRSGRSDHHGRYRWTARRNWPEGGLRRLGYRHDGPVHCAVVSEFQCRGEEERSQSGAGPSGNTENLDIGRDDVSKLKEKLQSPMDCYRPGRQAIARARG